VKGKTWEKRQIWMRRRQGWKRVPPEPRVRMKPDELQGLREKAYRAFLAKYYDDWERARGYAAKEQIRRHYWAEACHLIRADMTLQDAKDAVKWLRLTLEYEQADRKVRISLPVGWADRSVTARPDGHAGHAGREEHAGGHADRGGDEVRG
jgi:hypothetical protein